MSPPNPPRIPAAALAVLLLGARLAGAIAAPGEPAASLVRIVLTPETAEVHPIEIPIEPGDSVELDLPGGIRDWAGRGFTPDPARYAGDFEIEAARGDRRAFVTALAGGGRRILHLVFAPPNRAERSLTLEFLPAPPGCSWHTVTLIEGPEAGRQSDRGRTGEGDGRPGSGDAGTDHPLRLSSRPPGPRYREPGAASELGIIRTLRLLLNRPASDARQLVAANPALTLALPAGPPRDFGDFTVAPRLVLRDAVTDSLGFAIAVANRSDRRLIFDPASWVIRTGDRVYPVATVDFDGEVDPGTTAMAFLVLGRGPDGEATRLLPDNAFLPSVQLLGTAAQRPVRTFSLGVEGQDLP